jgi:hypothetical protein
MAQINLPIDHSFLVGNNLRDLSFKFLWLSENGAFRSGYVDGDSTKIGFLSSAVGDRTIAKGNFSFASGSETQANGNYAHAFGRGTVAHSYGSTAVGLFNTSYGDQANWVATDPVFEVGAGTSGFARKNIFTIFKNSTISMGSDLAYTKLALYQSGQSSYGMGVQAGQFRFNLGNPQARYAFFDQPGAGATEIFTVYGDGRVNTGGNLNVNGDITINGVLIHSSDRNRKDQINEVHYGDILQLVDNLPVTTWHYKAQPGRHMGPMAQDFYAAFGLGSGDTGISSVDADGVALASIKALIHEVEMLKTRISELENEKGRTRRLSRLDKSEGPQVKKILN